MPPSTLLKKLFSVGTRFGTVNPNVGARLGALKEQNRHYLAHEYFNRDWLPMSFSKMKSWLDDAKLNFGCSAAYFDHVDAINLSAEQQQMLKDIPDRDFSETVRDFIVNQQFRRDYWVRGARTLSALERVEQLRNLRFVLAAPREDVSLKVTGVLGEANLHESVYLPLLELLSDYKIHTLLEIEQALQGATDFSGVVQALILLSGGGYIYLAQEDAVIKAAMPASTRLNHELCMQARHSDAVTVLASPVTGGGIPLNRFQQLFLLAHKDASNKPEVAAKYVLDLLTAQGQRILIEGKVPETVEAEYKEAVRIATVFHTKRLPILKALRVQC